MYRPNLARLQYPLQCLLCQKSYWGRSSLCPQCRQLMPYLDYASQCHQCGLVSAHSNLCDTCRIEPPAFTQTYVPLAYGGLTSLLLNQFKFHTNFSAGKALTQLWQDALPKQVMGLYQDLDMIIPVPAHPQRIRKRGFHVTLWCARHISGMLARPFVNTWVERPHLAPAQKYLDAQTRRCNVADAFQVLQPQALHNKKLLLVDDVMTTGATLNALAEVCLDAGAKVCYVTALARA
ncbi:ComF family protein [Allopseudospirillum japonicum]|uniref:ComF family protein n=1 Tax=Allopseudospirillum japonicum TaxID=64971 RepID=UPI000B80D7F3|nr:double zinc ribbon domain-containing protein [Allopseudospirillum japonicum]